MVQTGYNPPKHLSKSWPFGLGGELAMKRGTETNLERRCESDLIYGFTYKWVQCGCTKPKCNVICSLLLSRPLYALAVFFIHQPIGKPLLHLITYGSKW